MESSYLLDTNICIPLIQGKDPSLSSKILGLPKKNIVLCSIVKAELLLGAEKSTQKNEVLGRLDIFFNEIASYSFDDQAAAQYAPIRATLEKLGTPIGANDLLIASIAIAHRLTLVTRNIKEFMRVPGLRVEKW